MLVAACGDSPSAGAGGNALDTGGTTAAAAPMGCIDGATQGCNCTTGQLGAQTCAGGMWQACICASNPAPGARVDAGPPRENLCKAGYYTGSFEGEYWSGVFDFLGTGSWIPVPVRAMASGGTPGLGLTLEEKESSFGQEFAIYGVEDGCVIGNADVFGTQHPFIGVLTGELDCDTGAFSGTLKGYYKLFGTDITYPFEGPVSAMYVQQELRNGQWDVKEHMRTDNAPGGSGSWSAGWSGEVDAAPQLPPECSAIIEDPGAGTTTGAAPGGTTTAGGATTGGATTGGAATGAATGGVAPAT